MKTLSTEIFNNFKLLKHLYKQHTYMMLVAELNVARSCKVTIL